MTFSWPLTKRLVLSTVKEVGEDDAPSLAAAIAYYTVFSLPPLLAVIVWIAGAVYGPDQIAALIQEQATDTIGPSAGEEIGTMIQNAGSLAGGAGAKLVGILALVFGATGAFGQLQKALNRAWDVEDDAGGLRTLLAKRLLSFGMVLTIAFLLLVSLAISSAISALSGSAAQGAGASPFGFGAHVLNFVLSLAIISALFALLFRYLPDAEIAWRDAWVGGAVTAVLFTIGKTVLGVYLAKAAPGSAFGAAGSLAVLLIWIYYSSLILLVGAEFTQVWATRVGEGIEPDPGAHLTEDAGDREGADVAHPLGAPREPAPYTGPTDPTGPPAQAS